MNYKKKLSEMDDSEINVCITTLFRSQNPGQKRTRDQNLALLTSWLHALGLSEKHEFLFYKDESKELWLLNRDQSNCLCCQKQETPSRTQPANQPAKIRPPKQTHRSVSPKINRDGQVTVITIQPQRYTGSAATSRQGSPVPARRKIPQKKPKKRSCWDDCCAECSNICSNIFS